MNVLFIKIYGYFSKHKVFLYASLLLIVGISVFFGTKLKIEENISSVAGNKGAGFVLNYLQNSRSGSQIVINVTAKENSEEKLIEFADSLAAKFEQDLKPAYISEVNCKFSQEQFSSLYENIIRNLPYFIGSNELEQLKTALTNENIEKKTESNYKTLISPAGIALKKFILSDPLSMASLVIKKFVTFNLNSDYEIVNDHIFTKDRRRLVFFVQPAAATGETAMNSRLLDDMNNIIKIQNLKSGNKFNIEYFGGPVVAVGNAKQLKSDILLTLTITMVGIFGFVIIFYKSLKIALLSFTPAIFGGSVALAVLYFVQGKVSAISLGAGSIILGIIVDYAFYIYNSYRSKGEMTGVIREMSFSLFICSITTATAFATLLFVSSGVLHDLGIFAGVSILGAALFSLIFLPHFLKGKVPENKSLKGIFGKILNFGFEKSIIFVILLIVVSIASFFFIGKVKFETDLNNMNFMTEDLKKLQVNMDESNHVLLKSVYVIAEGKDLSSALSNTEALNDSINSLIKSGAVKQFVSPASLLCSDTEKGKRLARWNRFFTPERKKEIAEFTEEASEIFKFKGEIFINALNNIFSPESETGQNIYDSVIKSPVFKDLILLKDKCYVTSILKTEPGRNSEVISKLVKFNNITVFDRQSMMNSFVDGIRIDFDTLVKYSLILISVVLIVAFGRIELGAIVALPMLATWLMTLGFMGVTGIKFNIFNIIISTFVFGLGTDYSILVMRGLQTRLKTGRDDMLSYKSSVFVSSVTTLIGVGVLIFAKHPALNSVALISLFGMLSVVLVSFSIEPLLFNLLFNSRKGARTYPLTLINMIATLVSQICFLLGCIIGFVTGHLAFTILRLENSKAVKYCYHFMMSFLCGFVINVNFHIKKRYINPGRENLEKPCVIICNHQSHVDIPLMISLHPRLILLTNDWVWNSPFFGRIIKFADYYPVSMGYEQSIEKLKDRVAEGYSIVVFPEGTRSRTGETGRFHKGAFYIAEKLGLDILPVLIHGSGKGITKGEVSVKQTAISLKFLDRIHPGDITFGSNYSERTKKIAAYFKQEFAKFSNENSTIEFFRDSIVKKYLYKGPILEWYVRTKLIFENDYRLFDKLLPDSGNITDLGCGYGFVDILLNNLKPDRKIAGIDYDSDKIEIAHHISRNSANISFGAADIRFAQYENSDAFLLSDVLHYFTEEDQRKILEKCLEYLIPGGSIIIRDANNDLKYRSYGTKFTEIISTTFGFNKAKFEKMNFSTKNIVEEFARANNLSLQIIDSSKYTSNVVFALKRLI